MKRTTWLLGVAGVGVAVGVALALRSGAAGATDGAPAEAAAAEAAAIDPGAPAPAAVAPGAAAAEAAGALEVQTLAPGFEYGRYALPQPSRLGPGDTAFVRVDPVRVHLEVRAASLRDRKLHKASEWGADPPDARAVAVMNSSMFADDWLTSVGHLEVRGVVQNARWAAQQNSVLVADPKGDKAGAALLDLACEPTGRDAVKRWRTAVQSIRMLGCDGSVVWAPDTRQWSSAIIGMDKEGRLLFLHTRAPYSMHDLAEQLRASPLGLTRLHYTEGGPEASLYVRGPGVEVRRFGSYETGFVENDDNAAEWDLPNVVVAVAP